MSNPYLQNIVVSGSLFGVNPVQGGHAFGAQTWKEQEIVPVPASAEERSCMDARTAFMQMNRVNAYRIDRFNGDQTYLKLSGNGAEMLLKLRLGRDLQLFNTSQPTSGSRVLEDYMPTSIAANVATRTILKNELLVLYHPLAAGNNVTALYEHVKGGWHMGPLLARLVCFAVEHALRQYTGNLRVTSAANTYLWLNQPERAPANTYGITNPADLQDFTRSNTSRGNHEVDYCVVYIAGGSEVFGAALLTALYHAGGAVSNEPSDLSRCFNNEGQILIVGDKPMYRDWPRVNAVDFQRAISEAIVILTEYNNVPVSRINDMMSHVLGQLPVVDTTAIVEVRDLQFFNVTLGNFGDPRAGPAPAQMAQVNAVVNAVIPQVIVPLGPRVVYGMFSQAARSTVAAVPIGWAGYVAEQIRGCGQYMAQLLSVGGVVAAHLQEPNPFRGNANVLDTVNAAFQLDAAGLAWVRPVVAQFSAHWDVLCGRALYILYTHVPPRFDALGAPVPLPATVDPVAAGAALTARLLASVPAMQRPLGGSWHRVLPGHPFLPGDINAYRYWNPVLDSNANTLFVNLNVTPRRFDLQPASIAVVDTSGGARQSAAMSALCPSLTRTVRSAGGVTNPDVAPFLESTRDAAGNNLNLQCGRFTAWITTVARLWFEKERTAEYRRCLAAFMAARPAIDRECWDVPDEVIVPLDGQETVVDLTITGGLWVLMVLDQHKKLNLPISPMNSMTYMFIDYHLAKSLLYRRACAEATQILLRASPSRVLGGTDPLAGLPANVVALGVRSAQKFLRQFDAELLLTETQLMRESLFMDASPAACRRAGSKATSLLRHSAVIRPGVGANALFYLTHTVGVVMRDVDLAVQLGCTRPSFRIRPEVANDFECLCWNGAFYREDGGQINLPLYSELAQNDLASAFCTYSQGDAWAVKAFCVSGTSNAITIQMPIMFSQTENLAVGRIHDRFHFPFTTYFGEIVFGGMPAAAMPNAVAIRGLMNWAAAVFVFDQATVLMPVNNARRPLLTRYVMPGAALAGYCNDSYTEVRARPFTMNENTAPMVYSGAAQAAFARIRERKSTSTSIAGVPIGDTVVGGTGADTRELLHGRSSRSGLSLPPPDRTMDAKVMADTLLVGRGDNTAGVTNALAPIRPSPASNLLRDDFSAIFDGLTPTIRAHVLSVMRSGAATHDASGSLTETQADERK